MPGPWSSYSDTHYSTFSVEQLQREIALRFPFYDMKVTPRAVIFYCNIDTESLEIKFEDLRKSLSSLGYIPMLRKEDEKDIIYVIKKHTRKERPIVFNIILFCATLLTTIITGSLLHMGYGDLQSVPNLWNVFSPVHLFWGTVLFSFPLMSILFIHEMGHYFASKKHDLHTSFPFFIPIPPILPNFNIGTLGALISSHDPMPDKKALFDVGISGPIAGFIIAVPVTIIGIATSNIITMDTVATGEIGLGSSILFSLLSQVLLDVPSNAAVDLNPIAFAGWIGLLITSINLLPAGQLDGGHIFRAVFGEKQKYAGWIAVFIMIVTGWLFFAFIIIVLIGMEHPPPLNDNTALDNKRKLLFFAALAILIVCYIPYPIFTF